MVSGSPTFQHSRSEALSPHDLGSVLRSGSLDVSSSDVYLQPHSDDICFSLGAFAWRRYHGILLTAFPISGYVALDPDATRPSADWVTRTRIAEDRAFAEQCGLH